MAILKPCSWTGCNRIVKEGVRYCDYHQSLYMKEQKDKYKEYKRRRMHNEEQRKFQRFYCSKEWRNCRELAILDTLAIDVIDYYKFNRITQGDTVHHVVEVSEDYSKRLDRDNLIYLTNSNHKFVHKEYCKGNKAKMQELLLNLKLKFMEEFNL